MFFGSGLVGSLRRCGRRRTGYLGFVVVHRVLPNVCSDKLAETRDFFVDLFGFQVNFDSDWYVQLSAPGEPANEIGIWRGDHELIPPAYRAAPQGVVLTVVVDDVDARHAVALTLGIPVVEPPRDLFYGQRSCLVLDPNGMLVDISTPVTRDGGPDPPGPGP